MSIKINGKPFDFDSEELYEGEGADNSSKGLEDVLWLVVIGIWSYLAYPFVVSALKQFFSALLTPFGVRL